MTGWTITPGYCGHALRDEVWAALERHARDMLRDQTWVDPGHMTIDDAADYFDHVHVYGWDPKHERYARVALSASGGHQEREWKEDMARQFVREILARMHADRLDASVVVS